MLCGDLWKETPFNFWQGINIGDPTPFEMGEPTFKAENTLLITDGLSEVTEEQQFGQKGIKWAKTE